MGTAFSLIVPEDEKTIETGEHFFQYHIENSTDDDSLDGLFEYEQFTERLEGKDRFSIFKKPTQTVVDAGEPSMAEIQLEHEEEDGAVRDPEGLDKFIESLEAARENLRVELDEDVFEIKNRNIEMCINIIEFAKENDYGVSL